MSDQIIYKQADETSSSAYVLPVGPVGPGLPAGPGGPAEPGSPGDPAGPGGPTAPGTPGKESQGSQNYVQFDKPFRSNRPEKLGSTEKTTMTMTTMSQEAVLNCA